AVLLLELRLGRLRPRLSLWLRELRPPRRWRLRPPRGHAGRRLEQPARRFAPGLERCPPRGARRLGLRRPRHGRRARPAGRALRCGRCSSAARWTTASWTWTRASSPPTTPTTPAAGCRATTS